MSISSKESVLAKRRWLFQHVFILVLTVVLVGVSGEQQKVFAQDSDDEKTQDEAKRVAEGLVPNAGKTPADIREEEKRIAYENSEASREAKRVAEAEAARMNIMNAAKI